MSIDGATTQPFSAQTITLNKPEGDKLEKIIESSRRQWAKKRTDVEEEIDAWEKGETHRIKTRISELPQEEFFPEPII